MKGLITDEMLDAAVKKAVEAGLLPRNASREDSSGYQELIRYVVQAALDAAPDTNILRKQNAKRGHNSIRERFVEVRDVAHWLRGYAQQ